MKPRHKRLALIVGGLAVLGVAAGLVLSAFQENLVFFYSPTQVANAEAPQGKAFRIGGLVEQGSVKRQPDGLTVAHRRNTQVALRRGHLEAGDAVKAIAGGENNSARALSPSSSPTDAILLVHRVCAARPTGAGPIGASFTRAGPVPGSATRARLFASCRATSPGPITAGTSAGDEHDLQVPAAKRTARYLWLALTGTGHPAARASRRGGPLLGGKQNDDVRDLALLQLDG